MILNNEFTVTADVDTVWRELLDMEGVATCLPGATVIATSEENTFDGTMKLKIGPMTVQYRGTAVLCDVDEEARTAVISLNAREAKGQGTAMATVQNSLEPVAGGGTRVTARTELNITGPQAQFGRGVIEDVGGRVMSEFSKRLEAKIAAGAGGVAPAASDAASSDGASAGASSGAAGRHAPEDEALDVGSFLPARVKAAIAMGVLAGLLLVLAVMRRRRL
jgi:carbon monoxide dehydrogenase subunit G